MLMPVRVAPTGHPVPRASRRSRPWTGHDAAPRPRRRRAPRSSARRRRCPPAASTDRRRCRTAPSARCWTRWSSGPAPATRSRRTRSRGRPGRAPGRALTSTIARGQPVGSVAQAGNATAQPRPSAPGHRLDLAALGGDDRADGRAAGASAYAGATVGVALVVVEGQPQVGAGRGPARAASAGSAAGSRLVARRSPPHRDRAGHQGEDHDPRAHPAAQPGQPPARPRHLRRVVPQIGDGSPSRHAGCRRRPSVATEPSTGRLAITRTMRETPVKVLYIAGVGRSGSTLLERMLGAVPGLGQRRRAERDLLPRGQRRTSAAAAGAVLRLPVLAAVGERGLRRLGRGDRADGRPAAARDPPAARAPAASPALPRRATGASSTSTSTCHHRLYQADRRGVRRRGGGRREQVDGPAVRAAPHRRPRPAGRQPGPRLPRRRQLLEQVRHPQAAVARRRRHGHLRAAPAGRALGGAPARVRRAREPPRRTPRGCATRTSSPRPGPTLERALRAVGPAAGPRRLDHVGEHSVDLGPSHGVAGSRTRFTDGRIELRARRRVALDAARRSRVGWSPR